MDNPYQAPASVPDGDDRRERWDTEPRRPTAVLVFSILCIVFGSLKLLWRADQRHRLRHAGPSGTATGQPRPPVAVRSHVSEVLRWRWSWST